MKLNFKKKNSFLVLISFIMMVVLFVSFFFIFKELKRNQKREIKLWTLAIKEINNTPLDETVSVLVSEIIAMKHDIPMLVSYSDQRNELMNIGKDVNIQELKDELSLKNKPIEIFFFKKDSKEKIATIYYGNNLFLVIIKYITLFIIFLIYTSLIMIHLMYKRKNEINNNNLWSSITKEFAHQIGTPLFSIIGWVELLKTESVNQNYIIELEKSTNKLTIVTDRFSKMGSKVKYKKTDVANEFFLFLKNTHVQMPNNLKIKIENPHVFLYANLNKVLFNWAIENLFLNSIDSFKGKSGEIKISFTFTTKKINIIINDNGGGIEKEVLKNIFDIGFSTKTRGRGIGLPITKRILKTQHDGDIKVLQSTIGKGTSMLIVLRRVC